MNGTRKVVIIHHLACLEEVYNRSTHDGSSATNGEENHGVDRISEGRSWIPIHRSGWYNHCTAGDISFMNI